ncbi:unnamed protein product [Amoebophrya sp. A120]|nr:unnamed protein product [Amoebophrya sp. A120]|eukprot:GSA120T00008274001.1
MNPATRRQQGGWMKPATTSHYGMSMTNAGNRSSQSWTNFPPMGARSAASIANGADVSYSSAHQHHQMLTPSSGSTSTSSKTFLASHIAATNSVRRLPGTGRGPGQPGLKANSVEAVLAQRSAVAMSSTGTDFMRSSKHSVKATKQDLKNSLTKLVRTTATQVLTGNSNSGILGSASGGTGAGPLTSSTSSAVGIAAIDGSTTMITSPVKPKEPQILFTQETAGPLRTPDTTASGGGPQAQRLGASSKLFAAHQMEMKEKEGRQAVEMTAAAAGASRSEQVGNRNYIKEDALISSSRQLMASSSSSSSDEEVPVSFDENSFSSSTTATVGVAAGSSLTAGPRRASGAGGSTSSSSSSSFSGAGASEGTGGTNTSKKKNAMKSSYTSALKPDDSVGIMLNALQSTRQPKTTSAVSIPHEQKERRSAHDPPPPLELDLKIVDPRNKAQDNIEADHFQVQVEQPKAVLKPPEPAATSPLPLTKPSPAPSPLTSSSNKHASTSVDFWRGGANAPAQNPKIEEDEAERIRRAKEALTMSSTGTQFFRKAKQPMFPQKTHKPPEWRMRNSVGEVSPEHMKRTSVGSQMQSPPGFLLNTSDDVYVANYTNMAIKRPPSKERTQTEFAPMQVATIDTSAAKHKPTSIDKTLHPSRGGTTGPPKSNRGTQCTILPEKEGPKPVLRNQITQYDPAFLHTRTIETQADIDIRPLQIEKGCQFPEEEEDYLEVPMDLHNNMVDEITQTAPLPTDTVATQTIDENVMQQDLQAKYDALFEKYKLERNLRILEKAKLEARVAALEKGEHQELLKIEEKLKILVSAPTVSVQFGTKNQVEVKPKIPLHLIEESVKTDILPHYTKILPVTVVNGQKMVFDETVENHVQKQCTKIVQHITAKVEKMFPVAKVTNVMST